MTHPNEKRVLDAWRRNAAPWTEAVRGGGIASRTECTNAAIVDAILARAPRSVLDVGCGEGWLVRALSARGIRALGVDAVAELVERAREAGLGEFRVVDYDALAAGALDERFDVVACNFSLFGDASVACLLGAVPGLLAPGGALIIQTLHPRASSGDEARADGWREGSWDGCGEGFGGAPPWYFRSMAGWERLFAASGLRTLHMHEPCHPRGREPASVVFVLEARS